MVSSADGQAEEVLCDFTGLGVAIKGTEPSQAVGQVCLGGRLQNEVSGLAGAISHHQDRHVLVVNAARGGFAALVSCPS